MSQIQIKDSFDQPLQRVNIRISEGVNSSDQAEFETCGDLLGAIGWPPDKWWPKRDYTLWINDRNVDPRYQPDSRHVDASNGIFTDEVFNLQRSPLSELRRDGYGFANADGRWFGIGATCFLAYQRFLTEGPDAIRPVLAQFMALGFNFIRVFGMCENITHFHPQDFPDYYDRIAAFLDLCAEYGLYVYWCAFADTRLIMPDKSAQEDHWVRTCAALHQRTNRFLEKVNEDDQHDNHVDANLPKPNGLLSCNGSYGGQPAANPPMPTIDWDFADFHVRRDYPKTIPDMTVTQLRTGDTVDGRAHDVPIGQGEPPGFGETAGPHGRWTDPARAAELSGTAKGTAAFVVFHSDAGVVAQVLGPNQESCARAFARAAA